MNLRHRFVVLTCAGALLILGAGNIMAQDSWELVNSPATGRIFSLHAVNGLGVLAGTEDGGMFLSTDDGSSWRYHGMAMNSVRSFYLHSDGRIFAGKMNGASVSTDNGATWESLGISSNENGFGITVNSSGHIFVAGWREGINRSTDNGVTWEVVVNGMDRTDGDHIVVDDADVLYAATYNNGLYRSTDNGDNWIFVDSTFTYKSVGDLAVVGSSVYAAVKYVGVYRSTDRGVTWTGGDTGFDETGFAALLPVSETELWAATESNVYHTTDAGATWVKKSQDNFSNSIISMTITGGGRLIIGTNWGGVYTSDDNGATWTNTSAGLTNVDVNAFAASDDGRLYLSHRVPPLTVTTDHGSTWTVADNQNIIARQLLFDDAGNLYAASYNGLFMTSDKGMTWTADTAGMTEKNLTCAAVTTAGDLYVGGDDGCFRRLASESTWTDVTNELAGFDLTAMAAVGSSIFAGTERDGLYRSDDNGASWTKVTGDLVDDFISTIVYDQTMGLYVGMHNGISYSSDMGTTWMQYLGLQHPGSGVTGIVPLPSGAVVSSSAYQGVCVISGPTEVWQKVNDGLYNTKVMALARDTDGYFYAGTEGNGIFRNKNLILAAETPPMIPEDYSLSQNYPNPFNPSTTIRYGIPSRAHVSLKVYNALGVEVATLVDAVKEAGTHIVSLQGTGLPSGQYFYQLRSASTQITRSMLLTK